MSRLLRALWVPSHAGQNRPRRRVSHRDGRGQRRAPRRPARNGRARRHRARRGSCPFRLGAPRPVLAPLRPVPAPPRPVSQSPPRPVPVPLRSVPARPRPVPAPPRPVPVPAGPVSLPPPGRPRPAPVPPRPGAAPSRPVPLPPPPGLPRPEPVSSRPVPAPPRPVLAPAPPVLAPAPLEPARPPLEPARPRSEPLAGLPGRPRPPQPRRPAPSCWAAPSCWPAPSCWAARNRVPGQRRGLSGRGLRRHARTHRRGLSRRHGAATGPPSRFHLPGLSAGPTPSQHAGSQQKTGGRFSEAAPSEVVRRRPTLPRGPPRSTIGAEGLNFRVRNGTGCFPFAMATETLWRCGAPTASREPHSGRGHGSGSRLPDREL